MHYFLKYSASKWLIIYSFLWISLLLFFAPIFFLNFRAITQQKLPFGKTSTGVIREWAVGKKYLSYSGGKPISFFADHSFHSGLSTMSQGSWELSGKSITLRNELGHEVVFSPNGVSWEALDERTGRTLPFFLEIDF